MSGFGNNENYYVNRPANNSGVNREYQDQAYNSSKYGELGGRDIPRVQGPREYVPPPSTDNPSTARKPTSRVAGGWAAPNQRRSMDDNASAPRKPISRVSGGWAADSARANNTSKIKQRRSFGSVQIDPFGSSTDDGSYAGFDSSVIDRANAMTIKNEDKRPIQIKKDGEIEISDGPSGKSIVKFYSDFMAKDSTAAYFSAIMTSVPWRTQEFYKEGERIVMPRMMAWYGPRNYKFAGANLMSESSDGTGEKWPAAVEDIHKLIEQRMGYSFNSVLLNLYRNESDGVSWHSDNESLMGLHPTIASVSLGSTRMFELRKNAVGGEDQEQTQVYQVCLTDGSLLIMEGKVQNDWKHRIKKERVPCEPRINLTFRTVYPKEEWKFGQRVEGQAHASDSGNWRSAMPTFDVKPQRQNPPATNPPKSEQEPALPAKGRGRGRGRIPQ